VLPERFFKVTPGSLDAGALAVLPQGNSHNPLGIPSQSLQSFAIIPISQRFSKLKNANSGIGTPNQQPTTNQHQLTSAGNPLLGSSRYPGMPPAEMRPPYCGSRASIR